MSNVRSGCYKVYISDPTMFRYNVCLCESSSGVLSLMFLFDCFSAGVSASLLDEN